MSFNQIRERMRPRPSDGEIVVEITRAELESLVQDQPPTEADLEYAFDSVETKLAELQDEFDTLEKRFDLQAEALRLIAARVVDSPSTMARLTLAGDKDGLKAMIDAARSCERASILPERLALAGEGQAMAAEIAEGTL